MSILDNTLKRNDLLAEIKLREKIADMDIETEPSEVKYSWLPEAFQWLDDVPKKALPIVAVSASGTQIRLSEAAAKMAGFLDEDKILVGFNKAFIAFKKDPNGIRATHCPHQKGQGGGSLYLKSRKIRYLVEKYEYPTPLQLQCVWDDTNKMLVARKPSAQRNEQSEQRENKHENPRRTHTGNTRKIQGK